MNPPTPRYVTCRCQHCDSGIEFDTSDFEKNEVRTVECPHCQNETQLSLPSTRNAGQNDTKADAEKILLRKFYERARGHFFGDGVEQDLVEAYKWIYMADNPVLGQLDGVISKEEDSELDNIRDFLADKLTPAQMREAHARAALENQDAEADSIGNEPV